MNPLTHFDDLGASRMVDVGDKPVTARAATASGRVRLSAEAAQMVREGKVAKGNVIEVARLAGIQAAKRTWELIPLCHVVPLDGVELSLEFADATTMAIEARARATARTGVEMEALVAVTAAALTIYDMCKSVDRGIVIEQIRLEEKSGGRSGHYTSTLSNRY